MAEIVGCMGLLFRHGDGLVDPLVEGGPAEGPWHVRPFLYILYGWVPVSEVACVLWVQDEAPKCNQS